MGGGEGERRWEAVESRLFQASSRREKREEGRGEDENRDGCWGGGGGGGGEGAWEFRGRLMGESWAVRLVSNIREGVWIIGCINLVISLYT